MQKENKKSIFHLLVILLLLLFVFMNLSEINVLSNPYSTPLKLYTDNSIISFLYKAAIIFDLSLLFLLILFLIYKNKTLEKHNSNIRFIIVINVVVLLFLIWFEMYYGSTFYYGEVQRGINNGGLLGSITFCFLIMSLFEFEKMKWKVKIILVSLCSLLILLIHYYLYEVLKYNWKILI